ncbi:helix-turn-helix domain-containing protein [Streptomyces sp. NPDC051976]|uniref:PucR family transcriptional regulator n=1 Tax=Streptomyces sp. NPDC051976 TaxID=3154947 RepID=UPI0034493C85
MLKTRPPADEPFSSLPAELAVHLRPFLPGIQDEVVTAIRTEVPEYARPFDDTYMRTLRTGVELALSLLLDRMSGTTAAPWSGTGGVQTVADTYRRIGRGEAREGRSLDAFQGALRIGARVAWRRITALADADALPRSALVLLGEAALVHIDEIAAATAAGYTEEQLHAAGELQRRRARLLDLLTAEPPAAPEALRELAEAAQWQVPGSLAVLVVDREDEGDAAPPVLPPGFLGRFDQRPGCVVVPDPDGPGRAASLDLGQWGKRAALGPTVSVTDGARSLRWAVAALSLARRGILPDRGVLHCAEHLATLVLFQDEDLMHALVVRQLAPLAGMRVPYRERLAETLLCWLQCSRNANEVAARLGVHPQTVRYRLRQLDGLFGDRLQDPDGGFELELALRVRRLRSPRDG